MDEKKNKDVERDAQGREMTGSYHPDREVSEEDKVILGDEKMGLEPSPRIRWSSRQNYVLIVAVIVVIVLATFWAVKGCRQSALSDAAQKESMLNQ